MFFVMPNMNILSSQFSKFCATSLRSWLDRYLNDKKRQAQELNFNSEIKALCVLELWEAAPAEAAVVLGIEVVEQLLHPERLHPPRSPRSTLKSSPISFRALAPSQQHTQSTRGSPKQEPRIGYSHRPKKTEQLLPHTTSGCAHATSS